jgi:uridine kinase
MPDDIVTFTKEELEKMLNGQIIISNPADGRLIRYMSRETYEEEMSPTMDWERAKNHLNEMLANYVAIGWPGRFAIDGVILPLKARLNKGERTRELYDEIMGCE